MGRARKIVSSTLLLDPGSGETQHSGLFCFVVWFRVEGLGFRGLGFSLHACVQQIVHRVGCSTHLHMCVCMTATASTFYMCTIYITTYLSYLSSYLSIRLSIYLCDYLPTYLPIYQPIDPPTCLQNLSRD